MQLTTNTTTMRTLTLRLRTDMASATSARSVDGTASERRTFDEGTEFELLRDRFSVWRVRFEDGTEWTCHRNRFND